MRFTVRGTTEDIEVIGERVELLNGLGETFAVHNNVMSDAARSPFHVTHCRTGFCVGKGETVEEAIADAQQNLAKRSKVEFRAAIAEAESHLSSRVMQ